MGLFQKSIEAIIAQGVKDLECAAKRARQEADDAKIKVSQCQSEIQSLVNLENQVQEKIFDRYSNVLVATIEQHGDQPHMNPEIALGDYRSSLRGLMGDETLRKGKYRVIVLLEPIS